MSVSDDDHMGEQTLIQRPSADDRAKMIARVMERYPPAESITSGEFECFVSDVLRAAGSGADSFAVTDHEVIRGADGSYDFDATARFEIAGMQFLVLIEAKRHKNPIKRELVQALHQKMLSVGASKALLVSAGKFQSGAVDFAFSHGIALATLSEGRLAYETRSVEQTPAITVEQARAVGMPDYSAMITRRDPVTGTIRSSALSADHPNLLLEWLSE